jgi:hypothetical protein
MTGLGNGLVAPTKGRPGKPEAEVLGRRSHSEEQATDLRHSQREEVGWPPFSAAFTCRRVTSR